jgi:hypothetical protein
MGEKPRKFRLSDIDYWRDSALHSNNKKKESRSKRKRRKNRE